MPFDLETEIGETRRAALKVLLHNARRVEIGSPYAQCEALPALPALPALTPCARAVGDAIRAKLENGPTFRLHLIRIPSL
jgi:hypothetical protein